MNGRDLTLGIAAGLAVAGVVSQRRRGSRELTALTAPQGFSPSQPWKGIVGAAKGGPSLEDWKASLARFPLSLSVEVVGSEKAAEAWLQKVQRPDPGKLRVCVWARGQEVWNILENRKQSPSEAFALLSPFTFAHRLFDFASATNLRDESNKIPLSTDLAGIVSDDPNKEDTDKALTAIREWAFDGCDTAHAIDIEEDEEAHDAALDACAEESLAQWASIRKTYADTQESLLLRSGPHFINDFSPTNPLEPLLERYEGIDEFVSRVLASLCCPTAAGRLLRLTNYSQAMADCYATWTVSGRNPLVKLTQRDLSNFSVDAQIKRWLATASAKKATEVQIQKYRRELERVAVPTLQYIKKKDSSLFRDAVALSTQLRERRQGLIEAANAMYALQRLVVI